MRPVHSIFGVCLVAIAGILTYAQITKDGSPDMANAAGPAVAVAAPSALGDLSAMKVIVTDTATLVTAGDAPGTKARIKDLETAWDDAQPTLQPKDPAQWDAVDLAADTALSAVRTGKPAAEQIAALDALAGQLDHPGVSLTGATIDVSGKPAACETLLTQVRAAKAATTMTADVATQVASLESKGVERCNSDDDARADAFFADALKLMGQ